MQAADEKKAKNLADVKEKVEYSIIKSIINSVTCSVTYSVIYSVIYSVTRKEGKEPCRRQGEG